MSIHIKLFGPLADAVGSSVLDIPDASDTESLKIKMLNDFPKLRSYQFQIAVSMKIVKEKKSLNPGDVVALLPPFAGG